MASRLSTSFVFGTAVALASLVSTGPASAQYRDILTTSEHEAARDQAIYEETVLGDWDEDSREIIGFPDGRTVHLRDDRGEWLCDVVSDGPARVMTNCGLVVSERRGTEGLIAAELRLLSVRQGLEASQLQVEAYVRSRECRIAYERDDRTVMDFEARRFGQFIGISPELLERRHDDALIEYLSRGINFSFRNQTPTRDGIFVTFENC